MKKRKMKALNESFKGKEKFLVVYQEKCLDNGVVRIKF
jgi:hypothetical protein